MILAFHASDCGSYPSLAIIFYCIVVFCLLSVGVLVLDIVKIRRISRVHLDKGHYARSFATMAHMPRVKCAILGDQLLRPKSEMDRQIPSVCQLISQHMLFPGHESSLAHI